MNLYSAYDYLAFIVPGGLALGAAYLAFWGWPSAEPGPSSLVILLGLAFLVGQVMATIGAWLQPVAWGHAPGTKVDPLWGIFGHAGTYSESEADQITEEFGRRFGSGLTAARLYQLAYTELQQSDKEARLVALNSQIGFCRNAAAAFIVSAAAQGTALLAGINPVGGALLLLTYLLSVVVFAARYRRFWGQFGDNVIRGFRVLAVSRAEKK